MSTPQGPLTAAAEAEITTEETAAAMTKLARRLGVAARG
jgi:hypothetical protein